MCVPNRPFRLSVSVHPLVHCSGGLELLFGGVKAHSVELDGRNEVPLRELLAHVRDNVLQERPELFMQGDSVRPGILVLLNAVDWELEGGADYVGKDGDELVFMSTLHGG